MQPKSFKTILSIVHLTLLVSLSALLIFVYYKNQNFKAGIDSSDIFIYIIPICTAVAYFSSKYIFQRLLKNIKIDDVLEEKLKKYYTASIIKYACIEAPAILAILAYLLSSIALHLVIAFMLLLYLYTQRPRIHIMQQEIPMNSEEKKNLSS